MKKTSPLINRGIYIANLLVASLLLVASVFSFLTIQIIPALSLLSLFVPFLFLLNFLFLVYWLLKRKRKFLLSLVVLVIGYLIFGSFYKIGNTTENVLDSDLSIMSYNTWGFNKNGWIKEPNIGDRIIDFIKKEDPDIVCIQEHSRIRYQQLRQYPYRSETPYSVPRTTQAIFSKYRIVRRGSLDLPETINNIIYADILYRNDTIRVYNVHLQSFNIVPSSETFSEEESERNYKRLIKTFAQQLEQAIIFKKHLETSPYTNLICGDFNNTQFSNVYKTIKGDFNDTFLEKGKGFGRSYNLLGFPIRIDYILSDPEFEVISHENFDEKLSDHYPVMATLRLKSD
ncbi:endonuclease/exonuclease/phosphatase family protein [Flagellimonas hymeniacidonis]|uniref:Endonuclease/exonuclease/phosphatase family protein n=1 Tax=Flagellimonas hymeniacidonis TaxID=2603628 RepID=A0A5C8V206_9FLAO|nr:endonuclease/exonuclease/phosphatase family protein [Flagellimonas hymeniacidonis]TXN35179.1 endonuclease/exonuclease/phosphatase family protein [Flagellimonas hymeniacidonis]